MGVKCVAPYYFHGGNDLAPVAFQAAKDEACAVEPVNAYLDSLGPRLLVRASATRDPARRLGSGSRLGRALHPCRFPDRGLDSAKTRLVFGPRRTGQKYPPPFDAFERFSMGRASGWICSGKLVDAHLSERPGYGLPRLRSPLGVDTRLFAPSPELRRRALERLELGGRRPAGHRLRWALHASEGTVAPLLEVLRGLRTPHRALFLEQASSRGTSGIRESGRKTSGS